ncbi:Gfo/Idh/MocA family oxidoreductase [Nitrospiraceae bacterium AH_259_D15_M11_P09]|nr:Gfo/Idh/MocA family oxidoreductase [Nitrospiraceae bacterium AH_259_D15_M11_P09]
MKQEQLKVGIAGYGVVGKRRRFYIDQHPRLHTVAVCDQYFGGSGVMPDGVLYFHDYRQLLEEPIDILFVSLPNYLAPEVTIAGLERGAHVFCEKPPGRSLSDIERVIEVEERHPGLVLKYGFNHRYHDSVREAMELVKSGTLGEIICLRGVYGKSTVTPFEDSWRAERRYAGGGILLDQGIHMVDLIRLFGGEFTEVKSFVCNSYWKHDVEDNAYALMKSPSGRIAMLHSSATQWQHRFCLEISLTEGFIELRGILSSSKSYGQERLITGQRAEAASGATQEKISTFLEDNSWRDEINEFAEAVPGNGVVVNGNSRDALETMRLVTRIYWSSPEWRETYGIENPDPLQRLPID